jgi:hypothetical protein
MKLSMVFIALTAAAAALLAASAAAKGPAKASVEGPGLDEAVVFVGSGEGPGSPLGNLTMAAGFFPAVFAQSPDPMLSGRPAGRLGPEYTITYTVPGPSGAASQIRQKLYPYAAGGPVTYMAPGQSVFDTASTRGGWYEADTSLKGTLVEAGLPRTAPATGGGDSMSAVDVWPWVLGGIAALALAAASIVLMRRHRPAAA